MFISIHSEGLSWSWRWITTCPSSSRSSWSWSPRSAETGASGPRERRRWPPLPRSRPLWDKRRHQVKFGCLALRLSVWTPSTHCRRRGPASEPRGVGLWCCTPEASPPSWRRTGQRNKKVTRGVIFPWNLLNLFKLTELSPLCGYGWSAVATILSFGCTFNHYFLEKKKIFSIHSVVCEIFY